jgi:hypothetical protein
LQNAATGSDTVKGFTFGTGAGYDVVDLEQVALAFDLTVDNSDAQSIAQALVNSGYIALQDSPAGLQLVLDRDGSAGLTHAAGPLLTFDGRTLNTIGLSNTTDMVAVVTELLTNGNLLFTAPANLSSVTVTQGVQNLARNSFNLWANNENTISSSGAVAPDGTNTAVTVTDTSSGTFGYVELPQTVVAANNEAYTASVYIQKTAAGQASSAALAMILQGGTTVSTMAIINTATGVGRITEQGTDLRITDAGDYWRVSATLQNNDTNTALRTLLYPAVGDTVLNNVHSMGTGSATFWGVQVEAGYGASAYVPTTSAAVTQNTTVTANEFSNGIGIQVDLSGITGLKANDILELVDSNGAVLASKTISRVSGVKENLTIVPTADNISFFAGSALQVHARVTSASHGAHGVQSAGSVTLTFDMQSNDQINSLPGSVLRPGAGDDQLLLPVSVNSQEHIVYGASDIGGQDVVQNFQLKSGAQKGDVVSFVNLFPSGLNASSAGALAASLLDGGYLALQESGGDVALVIDRDGTADNVAATMTVVFQQQTLAGLAQQQTGATPALAALTNLIANGQFKFFGDGDADLLGNVVTGTVGADVLLGTTGFDRINAGDGNDVIVHSSGTDVVNAGNGFDTYRVAQVATLDMTSAVAPTLAGMEAFDLATDSASNRLILSQAEVSALASSGSINSLNWTAGTYAGLTADMTAFKQVVVNGTAQDAVQFADFWLDRGTVSNNASGVVYRVYELGNAQVFVQTGVLVSQPSEIKLSQLEQLQAGFVIRGSMANAYSGENVSALGDVNGDGLEDFLVGAEGGNLSHLIYGKSSYSAVDVSNLGSAGVTFSGAAAGDQLGYFTGSAGDFNGDGYSDMLLGARRADPNGVSSAGSAYIVYGGENLSSSSMSILNVNTGFVLNGAAENGLLGASVASAGDVNGDGFNDVIVGELSNGAGNAYVIFGGDQGNNDVDTATLASTGRGFTIVGSGASHLGRAVSSAGDVNGDGLADVIVGAPGGGSGGTTYVIYGKTTTSPVNSLTANSVNAADGFAIIDSSLDATASLGYGASSVGDVNGDGYSDLLVTASRSGGTAGAAYVVFGSNSLTGTIDLNQLTASSGIRIAGQTINEQFGLSAKGIGDINADGLADFVIGNSSSTGTNISYVFHGRSTGGSLTTSDAAYVLTSASTSDYAGYSVSGGTDINGDGLVDLLVGAYGDDTDGEDSGRSYVVFGSTSSQKLSGNTIAQLGNDQSNTLTGSANSESFVAGRGDDVLSGNGGADVMYGGAGYDVFVINGSNIDALSSNWGANGNLQRLARIDGGTDVDTIRLASGAALDLTAIANHGSGAPGSLSRIESIEMVDMATDSLANTLRLHAADVVDMSGMNLFNSSNGWTGLSAAVAKHQLLVTGGANDQLELTANWTAEGTQVTDGVNNYIVYNHNSVAAQLLVDSAMNVSLLLTGSPLM